MTRQPEWKFVTNLGDASPLEYGGLFVYADATGVYPPEMERVEPDGRRLEVHRIVLDRCTFIDGVLSDNQFHPETPAWFADSLASVASFTGQPVESLRGDLCSEDVLARANAWRAVLDYHGWDNGDSYPLRITRKEAEARYSEELA